MCATFQLADEDVEEIRHITRGIDAKYGEGAGRACLSHDFFPKQSIPVIGANGKAALLHWGFPMQNSRQVVFNARAESLTEKMMFRSCLQNRCLIPATWFYEFGSDKAKYRVAFKDLPFFYMAGLWKRTVAENDDKTFCVTIITTAPNEAIGKIHNRMPAMLTGENAQSWLVGDDAGLNLLRPYEQRASLETA